MPESTTIDTPEPGSERAEGTNGPGECAPEAVRRALSHVLESDELRSSPQLSNILRYVVEATLDGRREAIKGYTIAVEALGRDSSFDPQADPIVRVEATRLRRALERYYAGAGARDEIEIAIPRGSYVPQFVPRQSSATEADAVQPPASAPGGEVGPAASVPAPASSLPAGESRSGPEPRVDHAPKRAGERKAAGPSVLTRGSSILRTFGLGLLIAGGLVAGGGVVKDGISALGWLDLSSGEKSRLVERANRLGIPMVEVRRFDSTGGIVLPPSDIGGSTGIVTTGDYTARAIEMRVRDGLARFDIVDVLASPDARPVLNCGGNGISPHSTFALGGLVENHQDGTLSVLLRLSDLCDGTIVWSREFDGLQRGSDPSAAEIALVREIMAAIAEPYGVIQSRARARVTAAGGPAAAGAYGCVLMAYSYWRSNAPEDHLKARDCLEEAVANDSTFALGYALLAELYIDEVRNGANPQAGVPALERALNSVEKAVELAPASAYVRRVLMDVHFFRGERVPAIAAGEAALELNPYDVDVLADFGGRLITLGETERGEAMLAKATRSATSMPPWGDYHRVIAAYLKGDAPAAAAAGDQIMGEGYAPGLLARALASHISGEDESAAADLKKLMALVPDWRTQPDAMIARFFPDPAIARRVRDDLRKIGLPIGGAAMVQ